ncbi:non-ribosomal peptide synthetase [Amycolatopsis cihanbeyliensis]|uniref:Amino acid adenylation domain-containing protein/thioester reductase-like protein n=1 Tax=Amycolatopsis cihanbeyliensis TaxID=1128664 RepID=A0A542DMU2_AMYCI|nr:non-ribosomal peptide synthetase [Amycolatopsis cihanbeyliensis]TQJ04399.1 amino acid adenylation domain-containing protein/thioester reductase-like protein [Amycolatopsis cihanbeyliensis]
MRLSLGQERLWLLQQLDRTSAAYNIPIVLRFRDGVDFEALDRALDRLVERHPVLRWTFAADESGTPVATPMADFRIPVERRTAGDGENEWQAHTADLAIEPFDLAAAPPVRAMVVECADGSAVLCLVMHHIITDGRSIQIVTEDLPTFYRSATPTPIDMTYEDFVAWQRSGTENESAAEHLEYWRRELDGFEPLRLPADRPRPANPGFAGDHVDFELPTELTKAFCAFALRNRCAVSSAVAAVLQALMSLHSGQEDITIGTVLAGRDDRRFADVLGFFVNTVVLRTHITPSTSFRELLKVARTKMVEAYAHQQAPFDQVVAEVRPERESGRNAIFDVVVVHNGEIPPPGEGEITSVPWAGVATRFDLELVTHLQDGKLHGSLVFRSSLFHRSTATRLVSRLVWLVEHALENPDEPLFGPLRGQLDYWRKQLADAPAALDLPADRVRPPVASYRSDSVRFEVDPGVAGELRELSSRHGVTPFMALLATFSLVLSRYARTTEVTVGVPTTGGTSSEPEPLTGFDANTLVLLTDLSGDPTFPELLGRVRETTLGAHAHQDVPFERLVAELAPQRDFSRNPLTQVALQLVDVPLSNVPPAGTEAQPFDLECHVADRNGVLEARVDYNAGVFDRVTIERFIQHFQQLLASVGADPEQPLSALPMMSDSETRRLAQDWNDTTATLPNPATVPAAFAEQVRHRPHATALVCDEDSLTYAELDARSNQLAHRLRTLGAEPGALIGVCLPRSTELITALLAILKTGAAYLPIDPEYPEERQRLLLTDGDARLVVTTDLVGDPTIDEEPSTALESVVRPQDLAYVIYTSGSTGRPKGVEIEHQAIIRLVTGMPEGILGPREVLLHASAISFDAATFEIWGALLAGATCAISTERVLTARPLANAIARHRISTLWLTSSLFNHIVDEDTTALTGLRHLLVGGEALSVAHVRRAVTALPGTRVFNGYGPTECTTFATCHPIASPVPADTSGIPIGRPIGNTRVYVLDDQGRLAPTGVPGELHVAGPGVARGYRGQPELTAEKFVRNLYDTTSGRLYRTGDLVRHNANGDIEFLGRLDDQIKIRGYRIEPQEIEASLQAHPDIPQAAVVAREDTPGQKRLVAYLKVPGDDVPDDAALRAHLRSELPEYMVPEAFVALPELPLTINGKLDSSALPAPDSGTRTDTAATFVRPRNQTEEALAAIWAHVLDVDTVGRNESFFDVGGHSLKAAQLAVRISETFDIQLPLRTVFERPTIAKLAEEMNSERRTSTGHVRSFDPQPILRSVVPDPLPPRKLDEISDVLLTGATGFVGAYLVRELLARTSARVHCLVRAADEDAAWHRLRANLDHYGLWHDIDHERIAVVPGDLAASGLGLTTATFGRLADEIDLICHNGARVDALSSYEQLEETNVGGTRELIRLAATTWLKQLQFVSTISAADEGDARSGYAETKSHAERLVIAAHERGMPAAIYRLPRIVGDSQTGQGNTRDIMLRVLRIILELGAAPDTELEEPWLEVDETAGLLARIGAEQPPDGSRFVLTSRRPVRLTHVLELLRSTGTAIDTRPVVDWLAMLEAHSPEEHAILKLLFESPPGASGNGGPSREFVPIVVRSPDDNAILRYVDRMLVRSPQAAKSGEYERSLQT